MKALYTTTALSTGGRGGHVAVQGSNLEFDMSPPAEMGGTKPGNNPEQLFAAGYAACFGSALQHVVRVRKLPIPAPDVQLTVGIDKDENGAFFLSADIVGIIKGVDQALADELVKEAHTVCPYSKATMGNINVTL
ncbi:MAG TPA: organic hydroperoxide resistance protein, partial [Candidatus Limiplasma sp.]|nr:organic hydroperoxide resistance protein [Candidatus Limiplasma sp.]